MVVNGVRSRLFFLWKKMLFCAAVRENGGKKAVWKEGCDDETNFKNGGIIAAGSETERGGIR